MQNQLGCSPCTPASWEEASGGVAMASLEVSSKKKIRFGRGRSPLGQFLPSLQIFATQGISFPRIKPTAEHGWVLPLKTGKNLPILPSHCLAASAMSFLWGQMKRKNSLF